MDAANNDEFMKVLLFAALISLSSQAARGEEEASLGGAGNTPCAKYAKMYQIDPETSEQVFVSWAYGYMSGQNTLLLQAKLPTRNLKKFYMTEVNAICSREPLELFWLAVERVYQKLPFNKVPEAKNSN